MGKLPIVYGGETIGEAETTQERLYTCVNVRVAPRRGLWRAWAVGDAGEVRIGTLEPVNGQSAICRRFSRQALSQAGELSRVELRPDESASGFAEASPSESAPRFAEARTRPDKAASRFAEASRNGSAAPSAKVPKETGAERPDAARTGAESAEAWRRSAQGQRLFRNVRFQRQLRNVREALTRTDGERRRVALVREDDAPFPLPELFCLASAARIGAKDYWVFSFDRQGWPAL